MFPALDVGDLGLGAHVDLVGLAQDLRQLLADVLILQRQDRVHELHQGHLGAQAGEDGRELHADGAGAQDHQVAGQLREVQDVVAGDDAHAIRLEAGDVLGGRPRGQDDALGLVRLALHLHATAAQQAAEALQHGHLVLLHEELDALGVLQHDAVLALDDGLQVGAQGLLVHAIDAIVRGHLHLLEAVGALQPGLGGDAAPVEAGAAQLGILLHHGDAQAELGGADGGDVAAGTRTQDEKIESCHDRLPKRRPP